MRRPDRLLAAVLCLSLLPACAALQKTDADVQTSSGQESSSSGASETSSASRRLAKYKKPDTTADILDSIDYAYSKNPDTVGWIAILDTSINNSVVQAHDNLYYLRRNERKEEDVYGCYFADYECSFGARDKLSPNTVVYGHSDLTDNPEGPRFSQLFYFADADFARAHPVIEFSTIQEHMLWEIFAVFHSEANWPGGVDNYNSVNLDDAALASLIEGARARSLFDYDVAMAETGEKILTLSTCTVEYGERADQRFVVMARLLPADAKAPAQAKLTENADRVQPDFGG